MDLVLCWFVGPAAFVLVAVGLSFGIELISGVRVRWCLRPALGLAAMIVLAQLGVSSDATAELTIPLIIGLGAFGLLMGWSAGLTDESLPRWEIAAALGVYFVFAAPVLLSGEPTWAGYVKLDDTGSWMGLTDHAFEFGRRVTGFEPSTWEALFEINKGYPVGSFVPMALIGRVVDQDVAWTVQPSMAAMAAILTLLLAELVRPLIQRAPARAAVAFLGAQSAMLLGYTLWGGVKEASGAALLALGPLAAWWAIRHSDARWPWILPGLAAAALIAALGPGGTVWLVPTMVPLLVEAWRRLGGTSAIMLGVKTLVFAAVATLPQFVSPNGYFSPFQEYLFAETELGNLTGPLDIRHVMGVWPAQDFRSDPHVEIGVTIMVVALAGLAAFAAYRAIRERELPLPVYVLGGTVGFGVIYAAGSPWVDGKAMTMLSPALLTAGLTGIALLITQTRFNIEGWIVGSFAALLILWGSVLAYQGVILAPRDEHQELEEIGQEFEGRGPALVIEGSTYGGRHFLRDLDAESAKDLRRRPVNLTDGSLPDESPYLDVDAISGDALATYNLLVFRRSPVASRPGGDFRLAHAGKYYEVWERADPGIAGSTLAERLPLGAPPYNSAIPDCAEVEGLATRAGPGAKLLAAKPGEHELADFTRASLPVGWDSDGTTFTPTSSGTVEVQAPIATPGEFRVWIGGDNYGELEVSANGVTDTGPRMAINVGKYEPFGPFPLAPDSPTISISYDNADLKPGGQLDSYPIGPVIAERVQPDDRGTTIVPASDYQQLCDEYWDWIEAYG